VEEKSPLRADTTRWSPDGVPAVAASRAKSLAANRIRLGFAA